MTGLSGGSIGGLISAAVLYFVFKFLLDQVSKRREEKKRDARRAELRVLRDARDDKRPTLADAIETELDFIRFFTPSVDTAEKRSAVWANLMLDSDLGRHAESRPPYDLDQSQRDTLLANARRDAAEALKMSQALMHEVRGLTRVVNNLTSFLAWGIVIGLVAYAYWQRLGATPWWRAA